MNFLQRLDVGQRVLALINCSDSTSMYQSAACSIITAIAANDSALVDDIFDSVKRVIVDNAPHLSDGMAGCSAVFDGVTHALQFTDNGIVLDGSTVWTKSAGISTNVNMDVLKKMGQKLGDSSNLYQTISGVCASVIDNKGALATDITNRINTLQSTLGVKLTGASHSLVSRVQYLYRKYGTEGIFSAIQQFFDTTQREAESVKTEEDVDQLSWETKSIFASSMVNAVLSALQAVSTALILAAKAALKLVGAILSILSAVAKWLFSLPVDKAYVSISNSGSLPYFSIPIYDEKITFSSEGLPLFAHSRVKTALVSIFTFLTGRSNALSGFNPNTGIMESDKLFLTSYAGTLVFPESMFCWQVTEWDGTVVKGSAIIGGLPTKFTCQVRVFVRVDISNPALQGKNVYGDANGVSALVRFLGLNGTDASGASGYINDQRAVVSNPANNRFMMSNHYLNVFSGSINGIEVHNFDDYSYSEATIHTGSGQLLVDKHPIYDINALMSLFINGAISLQRLLYWFCPGRGGAFYKEGSEAYGDDWHKRISQMSIDAHKLAQYASADSQKLISFASSWQQTDYDTIWDKLRDIWNRYGSKGTSYGYIWTSIISTFAATNNENWHEIEFPDDRGVDYNGTPNWGSMYRSGPCMLPEDLLYAQDVSIEAFTGIHSDYNQIDNIHKMSIFGPPSYDSDAWVKTLAIASAIAVVTAGVVAATLAIKFKIKNVMAKKLNQIEALKYAWQDNQTAENWNAYRRACYGYNALAFLTGYDKVSLQDGYTVDGSTDSRAFAPDLFDAASISGESSKGVITAVQSSSKQVNDTIVSTSDKVNNTVISKTQDITKLING